MQTVSEARVANHEAHIDIATQVRNEKIKGYSNEAIAQRLGMAESSVRSVLSITPKPENADDQNY